MYNVDADAVDDSQSSFDEQDKSSIRSKIDGEDALRDVTVSNPWAFAKMNAPIRPLRKEREAEAAINTNGQLFTPIRQRGEASDGPNLSDSHGQLDDKPRRELRTPDSSNIMFSSIPVLQSSSPEPFPYPLKAWAKGEGSRTARKPISERERYGSGALDTWVQKSLDSRADNPNHEADLPGFNSPTANRTRGFVSARSLPMGTPLNEIPEAATRSTRKPGQRKQQQQPGVSKPFASSLNDPERVWFDMEPKRRNKAIRPVRSEKGIDIVFTHGQIGPSSEDDDSVPEGPSTVASVELVHPDLASIMDYEHRKQAALERRRKYLQQRAASATKSLDQNSVDIRSLPQTSHSSPHKNRYNKAIAALHPMDPPSPERNPVFEPSDPRAYLIRAQQREDAERQATPTGVSLVKKRRKTAMLPLESVKEDWSTRDLVLRLETTLEEIRERAQEVAGSDTYITSGNITDAYSTLKNYQLGLWEEKLRTLLTTQYKKEGESREEGMEISIDLQSAVRAHLETYCGETM